MPAFGPLIAHRGASALEPENTLIALDRAADLGCGVVEIDVQVSADGEAFLMHDHTLERTTDGQGFFARATGREIRALRTRSPKDGRPTEHPPASLADALSLCARRGLKLVLEIKATWGVDAEDAVRIADMLPRPAPDWLLVTSFSVLALEAMAERRPDAALGLACIQPPRDLAAIRDRYGLAAVHANATFATEAAVAALRDTGLDFAVATVNDADEARRLLALGVQGVMTDDPLLFG